MLTTKISVENQVALYKIQQELHHENTHNQASMQVYVIMWS